MNVHSTHRAPPRMTEAFEHPAGSIAVRKAGGATQWQGKLLHIHIAPSASYEMEALQAADLILCEDTRRTGRLCATFGIATRLLPLHEHNEDSRIPRALRDIRDGRRIAWAATANPS